MRPAPKATGMPMPEAGSIRGTVSQATPADRRFAIWRAGA